MPNQRGSTVWVDEWGRTWVGELSTDSGQAPIVGAIANHSNAGIANQWEGDEQSQTPAPLSGVYPTVDTYAELTFVTVNGRRKVLILPAPQDDVFLADQETVDRAVIDDIIVEAEAELCDPDGTGGYVYLGGTRRSTGRKADQL